MNSITDFSLANKWRNRPFQTRPGMGIACFPGIRIRHVHTGPSLHAIRGYSCSPGRLAGHPVKPVSKVVLAAIETHKPPQQRLTADAALPYRTPRCRTVTPTERSMRRLPRGGRGAGGSGRALGDGAGVYARGADGAGAPSGGSLGVGAVARWAGMVRDAAAGMTRPCPAGHWPTGG